MLVRLQTYKPELVDYKPDNLCTCFRQMFGPLESSRGKRIMAPPHAGGGQVRWGGGRSIYLSICVYIYILLHIFICICICIGICKGICTGICIGMYMYIQIHIHIDIHVCIYTHIMHI